MEEGREREIPRQQETSRYRGKDIFGSFDPLHWPNGKEGESGAAIVGSESQQSHDSGNRGQHRQPRIKEDNGSEIPAWSLVQSRSFLKQEGNHQVSWGRARGRRPPNFKPTTQIRRRGEGGLVVWSRRGSI
ncbi:UNVERIFIED_CONTAM: hypothetical protein Slati_1170100 [Sesamum latifolium]|uniref:Uncharacterized protein n=1 Tax=Sesamum latifolium TaxID=2727402 RepID=A0AAW2XJ29_9LAMI